MYENITARFVQSHDYIAMERLFEIHETGKFDLIIIDTPPTRNALDFLDAPKRMADFFGGRLLRGSRCRTASAASAARMINVASRPFYQMADRLLGSQFLQDIAEFFLNFQSMYAGFVDRANAVERLLHDKRTTFAVVTTLESAPLHEAEYFCEQLMQRDYHLGALILNRTLPRYLLGAGRPRAETLCRGRCARRPSWPSRDQRGAWPTRRDPGAQDDRRVVPELRRRRQARSRAAGRALPGARRPSYPGTFRAGLGRRRHRRPGPDRQLPLPHPRPGSLSGATLRR